MEFLYYRGSSPPPLQPTGTYIVLNNICLFLSFFSSFSLSSSGNLLSA